MEFDAFACILKGGGGRVAPESLKIQPIRWICMVLEGPPPTPTPKHCKDLEFLWFSMILGPPHTPPKPCKSIEFYGFPMILGSSAPPTPFQKLANPKNSIDFPKFWGHPRPPPSFPNHANPWNSMDFQWLWRSPPPSNTMQINKISMIFNDSGATRLPSKSI